MLRGNAEVLDVDEGRCSDEGEHAAERQAHAQDVTQCPRLPGDLAIGTECGKRRGATRLERVGFRHAPGHQHQTQSGESQQEDEDDPPAIEHDQVAADERRQQGGNHRHLLHQRQYPRRIVEWEQVTHDHPRQHRGRRPTERLQQAPDQQLLRRGGQRAAQAGQQVQTDTAKQQATPAITIREWSIEQHAQAESSQEQTDAQLHLPLARPQVAGDQRQAGQVHVDRQGPERHQCREQDDQATRFIDEGHTGSCKR